MKSPSDSLYTRFASGILFPIHEKIKNHKSVRYREELEKSQWLDRESLSRIQVERLREFLIEIGRRVPYYKELFRDLSFDPTAVLSVDALQALPFLTKSIVRKQSEKMIAAGASQLSRMNTGGSTGEPLIFYVGKDRKSHDVAAKWRATRWWGVDIGDSEAVIWGSPIEHGSQDRLRQLRDWMLRSTLLPAFEMSPQRLDEFIKWVTRYRPRMLFGYPSAMSFIARHAETRGIDLSQLGIRVAFVTSERLYEDQRASIERVFGCPVANGYGGRDAGFIAHECPHGGMHTSFEHIVVEIVDENGHRLPHGQAGEITVTHLSTADFPFVRYRTGDVGVLDDKQCSCGRSLPVIRELQGRTTDFVQAADGTVMHGLALIYVIRDISGVEQFKITQESLLNTRLELVVNTRFSNECIPNLIAAFRGRLGAEVHIAVDLVEQIVPERNGKFRFVVSRVLESR